MGIKAILVVIALLIAGSIPVWAAVEDEHPAAESPCCGQCSLSTPEAFLLDISPDQSISTKAFSQSCSNSRLWILDPICSEKRLELSLPLGQGTFIELAPGSSGYAMLMQRLPWGERKIRYLGYVYSGHRYRLWFCADSTGTYEIWYKVCWQESNRIRIDSIGVGSWS